jgi:hypothetical protein
VVVEDVREGRRSVVGDLSEVGDRIDFWLHLPTVETADAERDHREDSVSGQP